ncbi:MAG: putative malate transporter YflS [Chlamydiia bacterium]|nr:putative malate transporter YflS [Chlamydiia bacterium]
MEASITAPSLRSTFLAKCSPSLIKFLFCACLGAFIWFMPAPAGMNILGWRVFAVFAFTLSGMILKPMALGSITLMSLVILVLTNVLTFEQAFSGFSKPVVWLIAAAFFIARGFIKTGLGLRLSYFIMSKAGKSTLGLAYSLVFTEFLLGPAIPSVTARSGGIFFPIVESLSKAFGSHPEGSRKKIGAYLITTIFQCSAMISGLSLTGMSGNPMVKTFALGFGADISWSMWFIAALVPGLVCLVIIPYVLYKIYPPEIKDTSEMAMMAKTKLAELGSITKNELILTSVFVFMIGMWCLGSVIGVNSTIVALIGVLVLVAVNILSWSELMQEKGAWDTLIWFASLITLATFLKEFGVTGMLSDFLGGYVHSSHWQISFIMISTIYFYLHYLFASNIAHITSMFVPFLVLSIAAGTPPVLATIVLGSFSCMFGGLTTYGCGPAPIYFGSGYVTTKEWFSLGFVISVINLTVWFTVGFAWWHFLGLT